MNTRLAVIVGASLFLAMILFACPMSGYVVSPDTGTLPPLSLRTMPLWMFNSVIVDLRQTPMRIQFLIDGLYLPGIALDVLLAVAVGALVGAFSGPRSRIRPAPPTR